MGGCLKSEPALVLCVRASHASSCSILFLCVRITRELLLRLGYEPLVWHSLASIVKSCTALVSAPDACRCFHIGRDPDSAEED